MSENNNLFPIVFDIKTINIITGNDGGVGKSTFSLAFADYLLFKNVKDNPTIQMRKSILENQNLDTTCHFNKNILLVEGDTTKGNSGSDMQGDFSECMSKVIPFDKNKQLKNPNLIQFNYLDDFLRNEFFANIELSSYDHVIINTPATTHNIIKKLLKNTSEKLTVNAMAEEVFALNIFWLLNQTEASLDNLIATMETTPAATYYIIGSGKDFDADNTDFWQYINRKGILQSIEAQGGKCFLFPKFQTNLAMMHTKFKEPVCNWGGKLSANRLAVKNLRTFWSTEIFDKIFENFKNNI